MQALSFLRAPEARDSGATGRFETTRTAKPFSPSVKRGERIRRFLPEGPKKTPWHQMCIKQLVQSLN